jgi:hypothetical protein
LPIRGPLAAISPKTMSKDDFREFCDSQILFLNNFLLQVKNYRNNYNKNDFDEITQNIIEKNFELNMLFSISLLDNLVIIKNLDNSKLDWEVKFFLKKLILNIYETIKSYNSEKDCIQNTLCINESEKEEFISINRKIKDFKIKYKFDTEINQIRNKIAGHINSEDFELYFQTLELLNARKNIAMGIEFTSIINIINPFLYKMFMKRVKK